MNAAAATSPNVERAFFCQSIVRWLGADHDPSAAAIDWLDIQWHERGRRSLFRATRCGRWIRIILPADQSLDHGAVLLDRAELLVGVNLLPCRAAVVRCPVAARMSRHAYLLGNAHLPAEILEGEIVVPASDCTVAALNRMEIPFEFDTRRVRVSENGLCSVVVAPEVVIRSSAGRPGRR